jgi:hypothetical protein
MNKMMIVRFHERCSTSEIPKSRLASQKDFAVQTEIKYMQFLYSIHGKNDNTEAMCDSSYFLVSSSVYGQNYKIKVP